LTNINPAYEVGYFITCFSLIYGNYWAVLNVFKDIYCQFKIFNDPTVYKTEKLKGDKGFNFNFSKQFTYNATKDVNIWLNNFTVMERLEFFCINYVNFGKKGMILWFFAKNIKLKKNYSIDVGRGIPRLFLFKIWK
jgi:hypothetical protein